MDGSRRSRTGVNKRSGHLFGRRFTSHLIEDDAYLLASVRYVLLNPVRSVGRIERPEHWRWSSTRATLGLEPPPAWLDVDFILGYFGPTPDLARGRFYDYLVDGIGRPVPVPGTDRGGPPLTPG
jgi:putative transposase